MQDEQKQAPGPIPGKEKEAKPEGTASKPEIVHIGSGGAFTESEGDVEDEQDQSPKTKETPY